MYKTPQEWLKELDADLEKIGGAEKVAELEDAQQWLDKKYPDKKTTKEIIYFGYSHEKSWLIGELIISDFPSLERIELNNSGHIMSIRIIDCPQLKDFECQWASIKEIDLSSNDKIKRIYIYNTFLETIKLPTNPIDKVKLYLHNNKLFPEFLKSLESFRIAGPQYYEYSATDSERIEKLQLAVCSESTNVDQLEENQAATSSSSKKNRGRQKKNQKRADKELINQLKFDLGNCQNSNVLLERENQSLKKEIEFLKKQLDKSKMRLKSQYRASQAHIQIGPNSNISPKK